MRSHRSFHPCALILALLGLPHAAARAGAAALAAAPPKLTLRQAILAAPPADGLLLSVSAEKVLLPDGAAPPTAVLDAGGLAAAFGDQAMSFGTVTAVTPGTMTLLNTSPGAPDMAADLNAHVAFKMLAASLDDSQWAAFTSEHGLGLADLTDDTQRGLFHAVLGKRLWVGSGDPALLELPDAQRTDVREVTDQIDATRLRLGQTAHIRLHDTQGSVVYSGYGGDHRDAAKRLHTWHPKTPPSPAEHGVALRGEFPNTLKQSDLDWDTHVLRIDVPTAGLKTVWQLVVRVGQKTGLELYADPHYAARTVTVTGTADAPAADLLRALCLCVTGTFRRVGPAYVLTDDLVGVGVRRKRLADWEQANMEADMTLLNQAGITMLRRRTPAARSLPTFGDPMAVTPEEMAAQREDPEMPGVPSILATSYPFAKLTPAQQAWARQTADTYNEQRQNGTLPTDLADGGDAELTPVSLSIYYRLQLLVPTESTAVDSMQNPMPLLFFPGMEALAPKTQSEGAAAAAKAAALLPPAPPLSPMLHRGRLRAVVGRPRTAADVDALTAAMQKLGLNALILDVFSGGVNRLDKPKPDAGPDILAEALSKARGAGIAVYADLSLLAWGDAPPGAARGLTIDGLDSREQAGKTYSSNPGDNFDDFGKPTPFVAPPVEVSPASPAVRAALTALVRSIAARPGLAGFVWEDAGTDAALGYTPEMRLAFLRAAHADPWDLTGDNGLRADVSLPLFDDAAVDAALSDRWAKARTDADWTLLGALYAAARPGPVVLPILMEQASSQDHWLASWDDPRREPPPLRDLSPGASDPSPQQMLRIARTQGGIVLRGEKIKDDGDTAALARRLQADHKALPTADGFVLNFESDAATQGAAPLDSLARAVSARNAVK